MRRDGSQAQSRDMTNTHRNTLAVSSLLAGLCPLVGNSLYEGPTGTGDTLMKQLGDPLPGTAYAGMALELVGFASLVVLLGVLVSLAARRAPVEAAVIAIAGSAMVAVKIGSIAPFMALRMGPERVDAGVAATMLDLNEAAFVVSGLLLSLALCAAGIALLQTGEVARWLAWWPAVAGALGVLTAGVGIVAPESYVPVPFLLLLVWMIVLGVATVVRSPADADVAERHLAPTQ